MQKLQNTAVVRNAACVKIVAIATIGTIATIATVGTIATIASYDYDPLRISETQIASLVNDCSHTEQHSYFSTGPGMKNDHHDIQSVTQKVGPH